MENGTAIARALAQQIDGWARIGHPALIERFVLKKGDHMPPRADHSYEMGKPKECFTNAGQLALMGIADLTYVEGYALRPRLGILIHHAWLMEPDGTAIDVTWTDTADCLYFGVAFDRHTLRAEILRTGYWGLLDSGRGVNVEFMRRFDPDFEIPEMVRHLFTETA